MTHVRYYIEWVAFDNWHDAPTRYASDFSYLDKEQADFIAECLKKRGFRNVQLVEFMADFEVPAVVVPLQWVR